MTQYTPDWEYIKAKEIVESLGDDPRDKAIKYYIEQHERWHDDDIERLKEYESFFDRLESFLPMIRTTRVLN